MLGLSEGGFAGVARGRVEVALVVPRPAGPGGGVLLRACSSMAMGDAVNIEE